MKKIVGLLPLLICSIGLLAQATPREKEQVKNDLVKEHNKRVDATKHALRGEPAAAKADHHAAVAYHKSAVSKTKAIHRRNVRRRHRIHQHMQR
jgi:hypothetical protein